MTGRLPIESATSTVDAWIAAILSDAIIPAENLATGIPGPVSRRVTDLLRRAPSERIPTAEEVVRRATPLLEASDTRP